MSHYLDTLGGVPGAVAQIVQHTSGRILNNHGSTDDNEKKLLEYVDKLTRTFAKALLDAAGGKP